MQYSDLVTAIGVIHVRTLSLSAIEVSYENSPPPGYPPFVGPKLLNSAVLKNEPFTIEIPSPSTPFPY